MINEINWGNALDLVPQEYYDWQEKRIENREKCYSVVRFKENPRKGKTTPEIRQCDEPDCAIHGPLMRKEMKDALNRFDNLRIVKVNTSEERAKIMRKYGKEKCSAFVNDTLSEKGLRIEIEMLISTDDPIGEPYTKVKEEDIERWVQKSFKHSKSGNLHKLHPTAPKPKREIDPSEPVETIVVEEVQAQCSLNKAKQIATEVDRQTRCFNPQTFEELKEALKKRKELLENLLQQEGIVILTHERVYFTIRMSEVDWST